MLKWALMFAAIALFCVLFGFTGVGSAFAMRAKILFVVALLVFLIFLVLGLIAGKTIKDAID